MKRPSPPVHWCSLWMDFSAALTIAFQSVPLRSVTDQQLVSRCLGPILICQVIFLLLILSSTVFEWWVLTLQLNWQTCSKLLLWCLFFVCHAAPINIEDPNPNDDNTLILTWLTPPSVISQGVEQYVIDVTPRCLTGENVVNAQQFVRSPIQVPNVTVSNLRKY